VSTLQASGLDRRLRWWTQSNIAEGLVGGTTGLVEATSDCASVREALSLEPQTHAYEAARDAGALDFWNAPEEDIYTFDDGVEP